MGLFGKKKEEKQSCCCGGNCAAKPAAPEAKREDGPGIQVLGSGCAKCNALEDSVREALAQLGLDTRIDHVTDFGQIAAYGVMSTPALVVDGKVVSQGRVLKPREAAELIRKARGLA